MLLGLVVLVGATGCLSEGGRRRGLKTVQLRGVNGYLEVEARRRTEDRKSKRGAGDTRFEEDLLEHNLKLETEGYVYHPNMMGFSLGALFGLRQQDFESEFADRRRTSGDTGPVVEFDFSAALLTRKPYPGSVYARRYEELVPRAFLPSMDTTTTTYGFIWQYIDDKIPTNLRYNYTDVRQDPQAGTEPNGRQTHSTLRLETGYIITSNNAFSFVYERKSVEEKPFELDYDSDEVTLGHRLSFGDRQRYELDSELKYFGQHGTFDIERFRWREALRAKHSETLRSWYVFEAIDRRQGSPTGLQPIDERLYSITAALEHKLYKSLISQFYAFASFQKFTTGLESERFGVQGNLDYRKRNRWGVLLANYRVQVQTEDREGLGQSADILDETHVFRDPDPVVLSNPNVGVASIVVTAEDGITLYQPDRDYTVHLVGNRVELRRVATGRILEGNTILVDYIFTIGSDFKLDTINQDISVQQQFDSGFAPYYRFRRQDQTISPPPAVGAIAEDIKAHIIGAEYRRGRLRWKAEYEDHGSTVDPFSAIRLSAGYSRRFESGAVGNVSTRWSEIKHEPPNERETRFFTLEGRYRHPITPRFSIEADAEYRNERDSLTGRNEGIDFDLSLEWFIRTTEIRVDYEFVAFDDDFSDSEYSTLWMRVRRRF